MTGARDRILAKVRSGLGRDAPTHASTASRARDEAFGKDMAPRPPVGEDLLAHFIDRAEAAACTVTRASTLNDAVGDIVAYLDQRSLERRLRLAAHPMLDRLQWPDDTTVDQDGPVADALVGVSVAVAGMAETGTLVLCSGPESATEINFLPEYHIVLLRSQDIVAYMEDVWSLLRQRTDFPPRALNFITGPSRTADVEQTIQLGAHGPRSLHLVLLDGV